MGCNESVQGSAADSLEVHNLDLSDSLGLKRVWCGVALAFDTTSNLVDLRSSSGPAGLTDWNRCGCVYPS